MKIFDFEESRRKKEIIRGDEILGDIKRVNNNVDKLLCEIRKSLEATRTKEEIRTSRELFKKAKRIYIMNHNRDQLHRIQEQTYEDEFNRRKEKVKESIGKANTILEKLGREPIDINVALRISNKE
ncbi:hypothetical protein [Peribacillus deserti]|uniref:Uncharacterized protein n=1 Tax=Peribacillus deserti TaxID=673318 RepID=A0A2N5M875_9BACI|nr:hypothetical protein [Peribacillus deserti]PLT30503.1 hypothetical protein CUU66_07540 [Peribacillus deserti]